MENGKIFISYRREDTSGESGRLKDKLEQVFGRENIFYDVETLEAGLNFDQSIAKALSESKVLLAMIGLHWLKVTDSKGVFRLQKPEDWVRKEISEALKRELRVIPVLVNGAEMPDPEDLPQELKELSLKHAQELTSSRWNYDVGELMKVLEKIITKKQEPKPDPESIIIPKPVVLPVTQPKSWWAKNFLWVLGGVVVLVVLIRILATLEIESYPENDSEITTNVQFPIDSGLVSGTEGYPDLGDNQDDVADQFIPDLTGQWNLYAGGEKVGIFVFAQDGTSVSFDAYEDSDQPTGGGSGQISGQQLVMELRDYANNVLIGNLSMSTNNSGQTWIGTIYFPEEDLSEQVELDRN